MTLPTCTYQFSGTEGERISIQSLSSETSKIDGNVDYFVHPCKPEAEYPLRFSESKIKSHVFFVSFDKIYPISLIRWFNPSSADTLIESVSVDVSLNGLSYMRVQSNLILTEGMNAIPLSEVSAKHIRFTFPATVNVTYILEHLEFILDMGLIVEEDMEWTLAFQRYEYWTGADGIFSFNLLGDDSIGADRSKTAFIFSDTFTGPVNPFNNVRNSMRIINNSLGYYNGDSDIASGIRFEYPLNASNQSQSAFEPTEYLGYQASNLLDAYGFDTSYDPEGKLTNIANGIMWKAPFRSGIELIFDFQSAVTPRTMYLWNFNEMPDMGVSEFRMYASADGVTWSLIDTYSMAQASGDPDESYSLSISIPSQTVVKLKLEVLSSYDEDMVGLGKIVFVDQDAMPLFAQVSATDTSPEISGNELTARLWLQDGIVLGNDFFCFPILVKDTPEAFEVFRVGMIHTPIEADRFVYEDATYMTTPLMSFTKEGGIIYFGAGVMDNRSQDGYIYVYGYLDLNGRHLIVSRTTEEDFTHFNRWEYFDGSGWSCDINQSYPLIDKVSAELSVTYMDEGIFAGKYMLVVTEHTVSSRIVYALSDTPYGPFGAYRLLYQSIEHTLYRGAITYNAKMHSHLSEPGSYLISYNVNSTTPATLYNANVYRPRFIRVTEVKPMEDNDS